MVENVATFIRLSRIYSKRNGNDMESELISAATSEFPSIMLIPGRKPHRMHKSRKKENNFILEHTKVDQENHAHVRSETACPRPKTVINMRTNAQFQIKSEVTHAFHVISMFRIRVFLSFQ